VIGLGVAVLVVANGGLGKVVTAVGSTFNGFLTSITSTPPPASIAPVVADAPTLETPDEPYTNEPTLDLVGTVPAAVVGRDEIRIRVYVAIGDGPTGIVVEVPVPATQHFLVPGLTLSPGQNTFTATIVGPGDLESDSSAAVTYVLDTTKPRIVLSGPKANSVVNARTVQVVGKTQARSNLSIHNASTNATVAGAADANGAFAITLPIGTGTNTIQVTATDPAGNVNVASVTVRRGTGALTANLSASFYQVRRSKLPKPVTLFVTVTDPDGRALAGASVTFTVAALDSPVITSSTMTTSAAGKASFTTTIPKVASASQCKVAVVVETTDFGTTTARNIIVIH
jgi:hypothetical protein